MAENQVFYLKHEHSAQTELLHKSKMENDDVVQLFQTGISSNHTRYHSGELKPGEEQRYI